MKNIIDNFFSIDTLEEARYTGSPSEFSLENTDDRQDNNDVSALDKTLATKESCDVAFFSTFM